VPACDPARPALKNSPSIALRSSISWPAAFATGAAYFSASVILCMFARLLPIVAAIEFTTRSVCAASYWNALRTDTTVSVVSARSCPVAVASMRTPGRVEPISAARCPADASQYIASATWVAL